MTKLSILSLSNPNKKLTTQHFTIQIIVLRSWMNSLSFSTHINILCKISSLTPFTSKQTEISLNMQQMAWYFYQTLQNNSEACCQNFVVSALMVLEIQSNTAHRLQTTDYIHDKSNTPFFFKSGGKKNQYLILTVRYSHLNMPDSENAIHKRWK
jgi:hypothetical protein